MTFVVQASYLQKFDFIYLLKIEAIANMQQKKRGQNLNVEKLNLPCCPSEISKMKARIMAKFSQNRLSNILQDQNSKIFVVVDVLVFPLLVIEIFQVQLPTKIRQRKPVWFVGPAQTRLDCHNVSFLKNFVRFHFDFSYKVHTLEKHLMFCKQN